MKFQIVNRRLIVFIATKFSSQRNEARTIQTWKNYHFKCPWGDPYKLVYSSRVINFFIKFFRWKYFEKIQKLQLSISIAFPIKSVKFFTLDKLFWVKLLQCHSTRPMTSRQHSKLWEFALFSCFISRRIMQFPQFTRNLINHEKTILMTSSIDNVHRG